MAEIIAGQLSAAALSWRSWRLSKMRPETKCILLSSHLFGLDFLFPIRGILTTAIPKPSSVFLLQEDQCGSVLVVAHTEEDDTIRIISARPATRRELKFYEEN
jgi:hypothetical protein